MTYDVIFWPVPERVRSGSSTARSARSATTRSIPMIAMCTGGSDEHMRPLPSFVTSTIVPVSATAKLTPVIPTGASRKRLLRWSRANAVSSAGSSPIERPASGSNSSRT